MIFKYWEERDKWVYDLTGVTKASVMAFALSFNDQDI